MVHNIVLFFNACYRHKYRQYIRAVWQGCRCCIQGDNNNNTRLKFQSEQIEGLEGNGIKIKGIKQAQTMNKIVEVIYRRGGNT